LFCLYRIAKEKGKEFEMLQMFAESTWGRGCDVNTDYDLEKLCNSIHVSWKVLFCYLHSVLNLTFLFFLLIDLICILQTLQYEIFKTQTE
jgi:hypothetical protein